MANLKPKVSSIVKTQFPDHIRGDDDMNGMVDFVTAYYKWLETPGNPNEFLHTVLDQCDVDTASAIFADLHAKEFFSAYKDFKCDRAILIKNVKDFFTAKGSLPSLEFLFNVLYDETPEVLWGEDMSIRSSSYKSVSQTVVQCAPVSGDPMDLLGVMVYGPNQVSTFVDSVGIVTDEDEIVYSITINDKRTNGAFNIDDILWGYHREDYALPVAQRRVIRMRVVPVIGAVELTQNGVGYAVGDRVFVYDSVVNSAGTGGALSVGSVSSGKVDSVLITKEGTGYEVGDRVYSLNSDNFEGFVSRTDGFGAAASVTMRVSEWRILDAGSGYAVNDYVRFYPDATRKESALFKVSAITAANTVTGVNAANTGSGYSYYVIAFYKASDNSLVRRIATPSLIKNSAGDVTGATFNTFDLGVLNPADVYAIVNGADASAIAWRNGGANAVYIENSGRNYQTPVCTVGGESAVVAYDGNGHITSIIAPSTTIHTRTVTLSSTNGESITGDTITVDPTNMLYIASGYGITGTNYTNPVKILNVSYDTTLNKYVIKTSKAATTNFTSGTTTFTLHRVTCNIREANGSGASIYPTFAGGGIQSLQLVDGGSLPSITTPTITTTGSGNGLALECYYSMENVSVTQSGYNYSLPSIETSNGHGYGVQLRPIIADGVVCDIVLSSGGLGYYGNVTVALAPALAAAGYDFSARAVIDELTGSITSIEILDGGQNFPTLTPSDIVITGSCTSAAVVSSVSVRDGAVRHVAIIDGGQGYYYQQDVAIINTVGEPAPSITATFSATVVGGSITEVNVLNRGAGYHVDSTMSLTTSQLVTEHVISLNDFIFPVGDWLAGFPVFGKSYRINLDPVLAVSQQDSSTINSVSVVSSGSDYLPLWQCAPLELIISDSKNQGTGAQLVPVIDIVNGRTIQNVLIIDGGDNYLDDTTIQVVGGNGSGAVLVPVIVDGKITDVAVTNAGGGYYYGTKLHVIGDGHGAVIMPVIQERLVVTVENGGSGYTTINPPSLQVTDLDGTGDGAILHAIVDSAGTVTEIEILSHGANFVNPDITVSNHNGGAGLVVSIRKTSVISGATILNPGIGYRNVSVLIQGDGHGAYITASSSYLSGIRDLVLQSGGARFTAVPKIDVVDAANLGRVSQVQITKSLSGFRRIPQLMIESSGSGAELIALTNSIGRILEVKIDRPGVNYTTPPTPVFPIVGVMGENAFVKPGELVIRNGYNYPIVDGKPDYYAGPHGTVLDVDFSRNLVKVEDTGMTFNFMTENGITLVAEANSVKLVREGQLSLGTNIRGVDSNVNVTLLRAAQAGGYVNSYAQWKAPRKTFSVDGTLNSNTKRMTNSKNIQDYSYTIKCGLDLNQFKSVVKKNFHPAGYYLWNQVDIVSSFNVAMNYERATNKYTVNLLTIRIVLETLNERGHVEMPMYGTGNYVIWCPTQGVEPTIPSELTTTNKFVRTNWFAFYPVMEQNKEGRNTSTTLGTTDVDGKYITSGLDKSASTPIKNWLGMKISDFANMTDPYFNLSHNWNRDAEIYVVRLPQTSHRLIV